MLCAVDKFLSLTFFMQAMIDASRCVDLQESLNGAQYDEDSAVFFLELLIKVVLQNRSLFFL